MSVLNVDELPVEEVDLHVPDLVELAAGKHASIHPQTSQNYIPSTVSVLESGLAENFSSARVRVIDCPDLRGAPYHLAAEGLGGDTRVVDLGGPPYLVPRPRRDRLYDLGQLARRLGYARALVIGAGAGPWPRLNTNCEVKQHTRYLAG